MQTVRVGTSTIVAVSEAGLRTYRRAGFEVTSMAYRIEILTDINNGTGTRLYDGEDLTVPDGEDPILATLQWMEVAGEPEAHASEIYPVFDAATDEWCKGNVWLISDAIADRESELYETA